MQGASVRAPAAAIPFAMGESYPPVEVERLLQRGELAKANALGWFGDAWSFRLVLSGAGAEEVNVVIDKATSPDLGLDLSNDAGVATVSFISPTGSCGRDGRLRAGDIVRCVNGETLFTCEAVVQAIKGARGRLELTVARPPPMRVWREQRTLQAGTHCVVPFEVTSPSCLLYRFSCAELDVGFSVARLPKGRSYGTQVQLHSVERARSDEGHVLLLQPGPHAFAFNNSYSMWRSKRVEFALRLMPVESWEAGQTVERLAQLDDEIAGRRARAAELRETISKAESRAASLREELAGIDETIEEARRARETNREKFERAKAERAEIMQRRAQHDAGRAAAAAAAGGGDGHTKQRLAANGGEAKNGHGITWPVSDSSTGH